MFADVTPPESALKVCVQHCLTQWTSGRLQRHNTDPEADQTSAVNGMLTLLSFAQMLSSAVGSDGAGPGTETVPADVLSTL